MIVEESTLLEATGYLGDALTGDGLLRVTTRFTRPLTGNPQVSWEMSSKGI